MPQFFFHVDDSPLLPDTEGLDLPDARAARVQALMFSGEMLRETTPEAVEHDAPLRISVTDDQGQVILCLEIRDVARALGP
jgi:hypothetical protein